MMTDWGRWWPATPASRGGAAGGSSTPWSGACWSPWPAPSERPTRRRRSPSPSPGPGTPTSAWRTRAGPSTPSSAAPTPSPSARPAATTGAATRRCSQIVGLNFYNNWGADQGWPLSRLLLEARRRSPDQRLLLGETGNCHFSDCHTVAGWLRAARRAGEPANDAGRRRRGGDLGAGPDPGRLRLGAPRPGRLGHLGRRRPPAAPALGAGGRPRRPQLHLGRPRRRRAASGCRRGTDRTAPPRAPAPG